MVDIDKHINNYTHFTMKRHVVLFTSLFLFSHKFVINNVTSLLDTDALF